MSMGHRDWNPVSVLVAFPRICHYFAIITVPGLSDEQLKYFVEFPRSQFLRSNDLQLSYLHLEFL